METPISIALSRQSSLLRQLDTVANNIANASTSGFRGSNRLFQEFLERTGTPGLRDRLSYSQDIGEFRDFREGELTTTSNPMDVAIRGKGFFVVGTPGQQFFTRSGAMHVDSKLQLVTSDGYPLLQANGQPITLPNDRVDLIAITTDGTVYQTPNGNLDGASQALGKLNVVRFNDEQLLRQASAGLYATDEPAKPVDQPQIVQGALEKSNIQPVIEITRLLELSRTYQALQNFIDAEHNRIKNLNTQLMKTQA